VIEQFATFLNFYISHGSTAKLICVPTLSRNLSYCLKIRADRNLGPLPLSEQDIEPSRCKCCDGEFISVREV